MRWSPRLRWTGLAAGVAAAVLAGTYFVGRGTRPADGWTVAYSAPTAEKSLAANVPAEPTAQGQPPAAADGGAPPGVSAAQWTQLQAELRANPDGDAELRRLDRYLTYADTLERFRALRRDNGPLDEQTTLALALDQGLPERMAQRELSAAEAVRVKQAVLDVLLPDAQQREHALAQWRDSTAQAQAALPPDPREVAFKQQQAATVAAWSAQPVAQRDPRALQQQLDTLRRQHFAGASSPAPRP